jgi:hypothetical protein
MVAIGRQQMVRVAQRLATASGDCLFPDVQVQESADFAFGIQFRRLLLEPPD